MKPSLFNSEMVKALLEGRKSVTRRPVKFGRGQNPKWSGYVPDGGVLYGSNNIPAAKAPYQAGDILWVRETWQVARGGGYMYKADTIGSHDLFITPDGRVVNDIPWRPSIHMPREAARIFLQVKEVWAERLQDIRHDPPGPKNQVVREGFHYLSDFIAAWERTIKPTDRPIYGWEANPWVWVISFEWLNRPMVEEKEKT